MSASIEERILKIAVEQVGEEVSKFTPQSQLVAHLGYDSLDLVEFVMAVEDEFGLEIPDEEIENVKSIQEAIDYVKSKIKS